MALIHSLEKNGNFLFKYRGQFPIILFILSIPVILFTDYSSFLKISTNEFTLLIISIILSTFGQIIRSIAIGTSNKYTSGRNTQKQEAAALNKKGIYSVVRHPLYLGNFFMWLGIVVYTYNIFFILIFCLLFWVYYERIMFAEERFLENKFGDEYLTWSLKVPAFLPSFKNYIPSDIPFSLKTNLRREYSGVSAVALSFVFVDYFRMLFHEDSYIPTIQQGVSLIIGILFSLILRSFKHYTSLLNEEDRS
ncbi:MAG: DUF1295 domain-containing protein [Flavobacteriia bacterium]|nr:DUF1295 domain-containing protein [Flavobacteriia bacterium]